MKTTLRRLGPVVPAVVALALIAGCGGGEPSGGGPDSVTPSDGVSPQPEATFPIQGELPEGILEEFPVYDNAELVDSKDEGGRVSAEYETGDTREEVVAFFTEAVDQEPWKLVTVLEPQEGISVVLFSRPDDPDINGSVAVESGGDKTKFVVEIVLAQPIPPGSPTPGQ